jgi:hypothetical protein
MGKPLPLEDEPLQHVQEKLAQLVSEVRVFLDSFVDINLTLILEIVRQNLLAPVGRANLFVIEVVYQTLAAADVSAGQDDWN